MNEIDYYEKVIAEKDQEIARLKFTGNLEINELKEEMKHYQEEVRNLFEEKQELKKKARIIDAIRNTCDKIIEMPEEELESWIMQFKRS